MSFVIAVSAEPNLFKLNRILNSNWAKKFPGASWLPLLKRYLEPDFDVVTADVAIDHVQRGYWDAKDVIVIQHVHDDCAQALVKKGALPLVLTCFESPLYVGEFYDCVAEIAPHFEHRIFFSGLHALYQIGAGKSHQVTFPSYFLKDLNNPILPWKQRKFMAAVIGNKYVVASCCPPLSSPMEWVWWLLKKAAQLRSGLITSRKFPVKKVQLQDVRLETIAFFMERGLLDLYGTRWNRLRNLPPRWQRRLRPIFRIYPPQSCENKLETIRNYRYGLCVENAQFPGYVTEKLIDCLVAGVIPLYMGAPDVGQYIPAGCFVDMRKYSSWADLLEYLQAMPEEGAAAMIACGREFLESDKGRSYSYEGFAEFMANIVRTKCGVLK